MFQFDQNMLLLFMLNNDYNNSERKSQDEKRWNDKAYQTQEESLEDEGFAADCDEGCEGCENC